MSIGRVTKYFSMIVSSNPLILINIFYSFENYLIDSNKINYIDDGPANLIDLEISIAEFDPHLKSNLNFRNPDAFKMLVLTSGLEELRAILHY